MGPNACKAAIQPLQPLPSPGKARTYQRELVGHLAIWWNFGSKAVGGEKFVTVIILDDLTNCLQRHGIGAELVWAHVVERGGL